LKSPTYRRMDRPRIQEAFKTWECQKSARPSLLTTTTPVPYGNVIVRFDDDIRGPFQRMSGACRSHRTQRNFWSSNLHVLGRRSRDGDDVCNGTFVPGVR